MWGRIIWRRSWRTIPACRPDHEWFSLSSGVVDRQEMNSLRISLQKHKSRLRKDAANGKEGVT
jgi:hypothetical protein